MPHGLVACLGLVVVLGGCLGDDEPAPDQDDGVQTPTSPELTATASPPPDGGVHGTVVRRGDVAGTADEPVSAGAVVVVPAARAGELWELAGFGAVGPGQPRKVEFELDRPALPDGGEIADLQPDGSFTTSVAPEEGWLCLADALPGDEPGPPFRVSGCTAFIPDPDGRVDVAVIRGGAPTVAG